MPVRVPLFFLEVCSLVFEPFMIKQVVVAPKSRRGEARSICSQVHDPSGDDDAGQLFVCWAQQRNGRRLRGGFVDGASCSANCYRKGWSQPTNLSIGLVSDRVFPLILFSPLFLCCIDRPYPYQISDRELCQYNLFFALIIHRVQLLIRNLFPTSIIIMLSIITPISSVPCGVLCLPKFTDRSLP